MTLEKKKGKEWIKMLRKKRKNGKREDREKSRETIGKRREYMKKGERKREEGEE